MFLARCFKLDFIAFTFVFLPVFFMGSPFFLNKLDAQTQALTPEEQRLEQLMEILYLRPERKSSQDIVKIDGSKALIRVWRDLPPYPDKDRVECTGYQWILSGRGAKIGFGAAEVFKQFPALQTITLEFVDLKFKAKGVDGRGKMKQVELPRLYLKMTIDRKEIEKFQVNNEVLKKKLRQDIKTCLSIGHKLNMIREINL